jgi:hypothetical protein
MYVLLVNTSGVFGVLTASFKSLSGFRLSGFRSNDLLVRNARKLVMIDYTAVIP